MNRYYICDSCGYHFDIAQSMHDPLKKKCPRCKKFSLYQDLTEQHTFVYQEPKTVGHQAERNREKMGKYELEAKETPKKLKQTSWYNPDGKDLTKKLGNITKESAQRYIMEG